MKQQIGGSTPWTASHERGILDRKVEGWCPHAVEMDDRRVSRSGVDGVDIVHTFDRTSDVSKLEGCNTRGIEYRWSIFERELATVPAGACALDFGAGSLRESFDLALRGFDVREPRQFVRRSAGNRGQDV